jgi:hypothetical protein
MVSSRYAKTTCKISREIVGDDPCGYERRRSRVTDREVRITAVQYSER